MASIVGVAATITDPQPSDEAACATASLRHNNVRVAQAPSNWAFLARSAKAPAVRGENSITAYTSPVEIASTAASGSTSASAVR